ncbi:MAG: TolC family outer membrane protein [Rhodoferax sp.]|nr:TolC family outer membrane protein [Rhodoferax sp.]
MPRSTITKSLTLLPLVLAMGLATSAQAQSLMELYRAAQSYDSAYQAAQAQLNATSAKVDQARALYAPSVNFQAGLKRGWVQVGSSSDSNSSSNGTSTTGINSVATTANSSSIADSNTDTAQTDGTLGIQLTQPLYNRFNQVVLTQAQRSIAIAEAALRATQQDLMVRVSSAYFDVLAASDSLAFVRAQKAAVAEQLASAKRNFEVGTATITDTREAQARFDLVIAQEIATENDLTIKKSLLNQQVGTPNAQPVGVRLPLLLPVVAGNEAEWTASTEQNQAQVQSKRIELELAQLESEKSRAATAPSLTLNAAVGKSTAWGGSSTSSNQSSSSSSTSTLTGLTTGSSTTQSGTNTRPGDSQSASIGVTLTIPLFTGRTLDAKLKETVSLEEKARNDLETVRRNAVQVTRTAFYGVQSGMGQVKAFEAAEVSSQSALDANRLGYQVGVRINIDVLNSQSQLFDTKAKLAKARYDVLVGGLKLRQAAGTLAEADLQQINDLLAK